MHKEKHRRRELIFFSIILFIMAIITREGNKIFNTAFNRVAFPANNSIFENFKAYFTSMTFLVIVEYFILFEFPNNYLLSRIASVLTMMLTTTILLTIIYLAGIHSLNTFLLYAVYLVSIILGQIIGFLIQRQRESYFSVFLGLFQYLLIASLIIILSSISPNGFLFHWFR